MAKSKDSAKDIKPSKDKKSDKQIMLKVSDVSKSFHLPTDRASGIKQAALNKIKGVSGYKEFHVLQNVNFEVKSGDFLGIVGRNGSGKSTLLKIISDIYTPNEGSVEIHGKLVPFIELGVGFNPELTGRENIYMNGALLGFSPKEMDTMYEEIVEFAELQDFMEQKLKNYSSGMQVRLAFSIAIKAEADILVLDEVLAVGDESFQRKSSEYFSNLRKNEKTVILVTHDMGAVRRYCNRAILINDGKVVIDGTPDDVANEYTLLNFEDHNHDARIDGSSDALEEEKDTSELGLSELIPYFKIIPISKTVLTDEDEFSFKIEWKTTKSVSVFPSIALLDADTKMPIFHVHVPHKGYVANKIGKNTLEYSFPLKYYNNRNFTLTAALRTVDNSEWYDESPKLIAWTNEKNSLNIAIRRKDLEHKEIGLLQKDYRGSYKESWLND
jgi:ABC-2 type transport system ATP-binding protein